MASFLAIGDPHFKVSNIPECRQMTDKICDLIEKTKPEFVVCLGDVLHYHQNVQMQAQCVAVDFIEKISFLVPIYVLIGNHDRINNNDFLTEIHAFNGVKFRENIEIIDTTRQFMIGGKKFTMVPYVQPGRLQEALSRTPNWQDSAVIFAHQEFQGAKIGSGPSTEGDPWDRTWPLMVSGHIHEYHRLQNNLIYTGTPMQHTYGDSLNKTVSMFRLGPEGYEETRHDLGLVKRKTVRMKVSELNDAWEPDARYKIRLVLSGTEAELKTINRNPKVLDLRAKGVKVAVEIIKSDNDAEPITVVRPTKGFLETLCDKIGDDTNLCKTYNRVFVEDQTTG